MTNSSPFDQYLSEYEQWFVAHHWVYQAELNAVRMLMPASGNFIEIGVGTGRFAAPLDIQVGLEPSRQMAALARQQGIQIIHGVAEHLPIADASFNSALMVTTICFVADIDKALQEAYRILTPHGHCLVGLVDRESRLGKSYLQRQGASIFYRDAVFYSVEELISRLRQAGFHNLHFSQTLTSELSEITEQEPVLAGYGKGSFVVVRGEK